MDEQVPECIAGTPSSQMQGKGVALVSHTRALERRARKRVSMGNRLRRVMLVAFKLVVRASD